MFQQKVFLFYTHPPPFLLHTSQSHCMLPYPHFMLIIFAPTHNVFNPTYQPNNIESFRKIMCNVHTSTSICNILCPTRIFPPLGTLAFPENPPCSDNRHILSHAIIMIIDLSTLLFAKSKLPSLRPPTTLYCCGPLFFHSP